jgi:hypothetical protein
MYRWAPDNEATAKTEPAPSDLLKATGILPRVYEKSRSPPTQQVVRCEASNKGGSSICFCATGVALRARRTFEIVTTLTDVHELFMFGECWKTAH